MAQPGYLLHAQQLDNFRSAYQVLQDRVHVAVRVQVGDVQRLDSIRQQVFTLLRSAEQVESPNTPYDPWLILHFLACVCSTFMSFHRQSSQSYREAHSLWSMTLILLATALPIRPSL